MDRVGKQILVMPAKTERKQDYFPTSSQIFQVAFFCHS